MLDAASSPALNGMQLRFDAARLPDWLRLSRRDLGLALTLAVAITVIVTSGSLRVLLNRPPADLIGFTLEVFVPELIFAIAMVAALKGAERLPVGGWLRHLTTFATAVLVKVVLSGPFYFGAWPMMPAGLAFDVASSPVTLLLYAIWLQVAVAFIARAWLVKSHEETRTSTQLSALRSEQVSIRRRLVEGRLKAIQARVDPAFFFDMLETVQRTYAVDSARAEQLLDELTAFLRAALPRLRTASSTVEQECDLARSFARLRALAGRGGATLEVDIAQDAAAASFPPGVLLPLIDELLGGTAAAGSVDVICSTDDTASITMQLAAQANPSPAVVASARATLADLFGSAASLTSVDTGNGSRTRIKIPYEPVSA